MNVSTKKHGRRALSRKCSEEGMRKDPIVAKELGVQRLPDTGILLNKASIVQRRHAHWHKKMTRGGGGGGERRLLRLQTPA